MTSSAAPSIRMRPDRWTGPLRAWIARAVGVWSGKSDRWSELTRSEERYHAIFDQSPWPMWVYEPASLRVVEVNAAAVLQYGYTRDEFLAMTLFDLLPPEGRPGLSDAVATLGEERRVTRQVRHQNRRGEIIDVEVTAHPLHFDGRDLRLAAGVDVTAREQAVRSLREQEWKFRSVANCLREALLITDTEDRIVLANKRVLDVLGYEPAAVIGRSATELLLPASERNAFRDRMRQRLGGESELYELTLVRGDGGTITAEVSASPFRDSDGNIIGTLGAISDVSERKRLEDRVRQATRLEAVGQLAGGVAHDFNNLLTVIRCHAEILRDDLPPGEDLQTSVHEIECAADRAAEVTGRLLAFSRRQVMLPRRLLLDRIVTETLPVLRDMAGPRVSIVTSTDASSPEVKADPTQMENVLITLVRNACDAMPQGGRITIATQTRSMPDQDLAFQSQHLPAGAYTVLAVSDTGAGMDRGVQQRLFEPFFTTKDVGAGSGLGLASMFGIVRQSGGYVDVRSTPREGTTFLIYLPSTSAPAVTAAMPS